MLKSGGRESLKARPTKRSKQRRKPVLLHSPKLERVAEAWEKAFWKELNALCLACKKDCKQSSRVEIMSCVKFEKG